MGSKPIRVFWSELSQRFYASRAYKSEVRDGREFVTITGQKFDVTDAIARAVLDHDIVFSRSTDTGGEGG